MRINSRVASVSGVAGFFLIWEGCVRAFGLKPAVLPRPSLVADELLTNLPHYASHARVTLGEGLGGLLLAFVAAATISTLMVLSPSIEKASWPVLIMIQATPVVVLGPILAGLLGLSFWPKVVVAALFAFVPLASAMFTGLKSVDAATLELVQSVSASRAQILWHLRVPSALPSIFSIGKIAFTLTLLGAFIAELTGISRAGLGHVFGTAWASSRVYEAWATIFMTGFLGLAATSLITALERRMLRWHESQHQPS